jgi:cytidine deaminase
MDETALHETIAACRNLIITRFPEEPDRGAAAVLLGDGTILTGTSPDFTNPSTVVCHELEPYCGAFRLGQKIIASVCLHRTSDGRFLVLSPCGVRRERVADHGPGVLVAVPDQGDATQVRWLTLGEALPHYWMNAFSEGSEAWRD